MSLVSGAMASALSALSSAVGQSLSYTLLAKPQTWVALTGGLLQQSAPVVTSYDEKHMATLAPQTARLKVPVGGVHLTPGAGNAMIKDQAGTVWAVVGVSHANGQSIYELQRAPVQSQGDPRGSNPA